MSKSAPSRKKRYCNECGGNTWHDVLWMQDQKWLDDTNSIHTVTGGVERFVLQCRGCEAVSFETTSWCSEDIEPDGSLAKETYVYPPKTLRSKPHWYGDLLFDALFDKKHFLPLLDEVYVALQNNCPSLAVMGIRALLEAIMIEKCGDQGSFRRNVDKFSELGYISNVQREAIDPVLQAGHAAIHRSFKPQPKEVLVALDITENIIESIFISTEKAGTLRGKVPRWTTNT